MNILLLGNGFDLFHNLPTKYINFLNIVDYLAHTNWGNVRTVGDIFESLKLQEMDAGIAKSYNKYKSAYDKAPLNYDVVERLSSLARSNIWFKYLLNSFNKDIGWIDFEKEISTVIYYFEQLLKENDTVLFTNKTFPSGEGQYIVRQFPFLWDENESTHILWVINDEYLIEYPLGSNIKNVNKKKIVDKLADAVLELAEGLRLYLEYFVENVVEIIAEEDSAELCKAFLYTDYVVTLNYTSTFEKLYSSVQTFHLHGDVSKKIVLGINPDESDELETVDTTFIQFKKYHQRTLFETDTAYIKWLREKRSERPSVEDNHLLVMGHSLDMTDKDIITELFDLSDDITILYHSKAAESEYIANLVRIFGLDKFLMFRREKNLTFLPLDMDFTEFSENRAGNQLLEAFADTFS